MMPQYRKLTTLCYAAVLAFGLAACGGGGTETAEAPPAPPAPPDLGPAQMAAMAAATAANEAHANAMAAVAAQEANKDADLASYGAASSAANRAMAHAMAADAAAAAAAAATDLAAAEAARDDALAAQALAESEETHADMYADMVMAAHVEAVALMTAMTAADTAATAAETAATAAETAAAKVTELVGAGTMQAMDADEAAEAARSAATAARDASDLADAAMESGVAEGHQMTAETEQGKAETQLAMAAELQRESQVAHDTSALQNEMRDIADGRADAKMYSELAAGHYDSAVAKQGLARAQATAARTAANRAKASRQDYANANTHALAAEAAADAADAAVALALAAKNAAAEAYMTAMADDVTGAAAKAAAAEARAQNVIATAQHTGENGAGANYMAAKAAAEKAIEAADVYIAQTDILRLANQVEIPLASRPARVKLVNAAINAQAADGDGDETPNAAGTTASEATVAWNYHGSLGDPDEIGGTGEGADTKPGEGRVVISVNAGGTEFDQRYDKATTAGTNESNFSQGIGLGDFAEYHIRSGDETASPAALPRTRVLVFTDRVQNAAPIPGGTVAFTNLAPVAERVRTWGATDVTYDHDGVAATDPIAVTVACPELANVVTTCSATEIGNTGFVSAISGYRISTVTGGVEVAAVDERVNAKWLSFGVWLTEGTDDPVHTFGAVADGGTTVPDGGTPIGMTGTATYEGSAAGLHSTPTAAEFFSAAATLTANFDVKDENNAAASGGTIKGRIHNIVSGGQPMSGSIHLDVTAGTENNANVDDNGAFNGRARMGTGTTDADTGNILYPYNGTWAGQFYNAVPNNPRTAAAENLTTPPNSVAGTFGVSHTDEMGTPTDATDDETSSFVGGFGAHKQ
jgi:hypothetical protein